MDEYYCPNCGATLNDQSGFDPDDGHWKCTECGTNLFDEDAEEGERFEDTFWVCDYCGKSLSSQSGFSDSYSLWTCTECGFINRISEGDILDEDEEFDHNKVPEYAEGFWDVDYSAARKRVDDNDNDDVDDVDVHDEDVHVGDVHVGDVHVGDVHVGDFHAEDVHVEDFHADGDKDDYDIDDDDDDDDDYYSDSDDEHSSAEDDDCTASQQSDEPVNYAEHTQDNADAAEEALRHYVASQRRKAFFRNHWKVFAVLIIAAILALAGLYAYWESQQHYQVPISSEDAIGKQYKEIAAQFEAAGFTSVSCEGLRDLSSNELEKEGTVGELSIGDSTSFNGNAIFRYDTPVLIRYHSIRYATPPLTRKEAKGQDFREIVRQFEEAGFENIRTEASRDSVVGLINKVDMVKSVTVDGDKRYKADQEFPVNCEVVIYYHAHAFGE